MPIRHEALLRRRLLLGFSQESLAICCGLSIGTVGRLERGEAPNDGGNLTVDTASRLCQALQMELHELIVPPVGNRYEKAARFAAEEHSPRAAPHLHDRGRSAKSRAYRRLIHESRSEYDEEVLAAEAPDELHPAVPRPQRSLAEILAAPTPDHGSPGTFGPEETHRTSPEQLERVADVGRTLIPYSEPAGPDGEDAVEGTYTDWHFSDPSTE